MITDNQIDELFEDFEEIVDSATQELIGLCLIIQFDGNAHVLGIGAKEHMDNIVACMKGSGGEVISKRDVN